MDRFLGSSITRGYTLASKMYPSIFPRDVTSRYPINSQSQRVLLENGLIQHAGKPGLFHLLPMAVRSLEKLSRIIMDEMDAIGGQRISMPSLAEKSFFERAGRWEAFGRDLFRLKDRQDDEYCLAPTHEEHVANLVSTNHATLTKPLILYQITSKFRDEAHSRFGLLRCREFLMKDAYSFDSDENEASKTYELCTTAYDRIFRHRLNSPTMRVRSDVGAMGGTSSHEYHLRNECGEDRIDFCQRCEIGVNRELLVDAKNDEPSKCTNCGEKTETFRTVEIAHTFVLGTNYSTAFSANFSTSDGQKSPAFMGCYGIGVTRLLAALIDLNLYEKKQIRWPLSIAPYKLCIIPPSKNESQKDKGLAAEFARDILDRLSHVDWLKNEIVFDDRTDLTVGHRLVLAKKIGYPFVVVSNKSVVKESIPKLELFDLTNGKEKMELVTHEELFERIRNLRTD